VNRPHERPEDAPNGRKKLIDELNKKKWLDEMEDQIAQSAVYPLSEKLMAFWRVSRETGMIFHLAEMHLSNAEFQLGRYHAAVAENITKHNILVELSKESARLIDERTNRSAVTSAKGAQKTQNVIDRVKELPNDMTETRRLMHELESKRRTQFLEAHIYFVLVYDIQKCLKTICRLEKEDVELKELKNELDSSKAFGGARRLLEHLDGDIERGNIFDLGNLTGDREEIFTYEYREDDQVKRGEAYLTEQEFIAVKQLVQRVFEILHKRPRNSGVEADSKTAQENQEGGHNYYQGNIA
jgi:hypothetical protein